MNFHSKFRKLNYSLLIFLGFYYEKADIKYKISNFTNYELKYSIINITNSNFIKKLEKKNPNLK